MQRLNGLVDLLLFIALGAFSGLMAGCFGVGGGVLVVPGLAFIFLSMGVSHDLIMQLAAGTSLCIMIFTALSSSYSHHKQKNIVWPMFVRMLPYILLGTITGALLAKYLPSEFLKILFALFLVAVGLKMLIKIKLRPGELPEPKKSLVRSAAAVIGLQSGLLGVGGGTLSVPFLSHCHFPMRQAAGTSSLFTLPIALMGAVAFGLLGTGQVSIHWVSGFIYWPAVLCIAPLGVVCAPIGTKIAQFLPQDVLRRVFAILLIVLSAKMFGIF